MTGQIIAREIALWYLSGFCSWWFIQATAAFFEWYEGALTRAARESVLSQAAAARSALGETER